ncbi:MAG: hypothetical protein KF812_07165 [Fimbriimonadaceae bacterium]|nr:hypothetical protein [Fimbriimonadaceae bacterium]
MPEFLVVVPTIRLHLEGFAETISHIEGSFTRPTEFHVLDGTGGKVPALNRAYHDLLLPSDCQFYATIDDDSLPTSGWQDAAVAAFADDPTLGIISPWLGNDDWSLDVMGRDSVGPWETLGNQRIRRLKPWRHIPGGLLTFRRECVLAVGPQPETGLAYEIYEDAWRGRVALREGWHSAYTENGSPLRFFNYVDDPEYLAQKEKDIAASRAQQDAVFDAARVGDPLSWRLRRMIAKLRGRG